MRVRNPPQSLVFEHASWGVNGAPHTLIPRYPLESAIGVGDAFYLCYYDDTEGQTHHFVELTQIRVLEKEAVEFVAERRGIAVSKGAPFFLLQVDRANAKIGAWTLVKSTIQRPRTTTIVPRRRDEPDAPAAETNTHGVEAQGVYDTPTFGLPRNSIERFMSSLRSERTSVVSTSSSNGFGEIKITEETKVVDATTRTSSSGRGVHGVGGRGQAAEGGAEGRGETPDA